MVGNYVRRNQSIKEKVVLEWRADHKKDGEFGKFRKIEGFGNFLRTTDQLRSVFLDIFSLMTRTLTRF